MNQTPVTLIRSFFFAFAIGTCFLSYAAQSPAADSRAAQGPTVATCRSLLARAMAEYSMNARFDLFSSLFNASSRLVQKEGSAESWRLYGIAAIYLNSETAITTAAGALERLALTGPVSPEVESVSRALAAQRIGRGLASDIAGTPQSRPVWREVIQADPDPKVVQSDVVRTSILATGLPWRVRDSSTRIEFLLVPPGRYRRGASPDDAEAASREKPAHDFVITRPFYLGRFEVTNADFRRYSPGHAALSPNYDRNANADDRPVCEIDPKEIDQFCRAYGFRLPTQAEWEYACRAGTTSARYGVLKAVAWTKIDRTGRAEDGLIGTPRWRPLREYAAARVGTKAPNAFGFFDMLGNVAEWTSDVSYFAGGSQDISSHRLLESSPTTDRVICGGSWNSDPADCRASACYRAVNSWVYADTGFRVARDT